MAKQKGYIDLEGTLGGLTFYRSGGNSIVKTKSGVNKDRILKEARFKRTRENMAEFGGAAKVGKSLRHGLASVIKLMSDRTVTGRLTGVMKRINANGSGARGKRNFDILPNKVLLEGFEYNKFATFETVFYAPFVPPVLDANRNQVTWSIPDFNTANYINPPEGATHFKLVLAVTALSDFVYNTSLKGYEPVNPIENEANNTVMTPEIQLGTDIGAVTSLTADLGFTSALPATVAVIINLGIIFYQQINTQFYELASDNAMSLNLVG